MNSKSMHRIYLDNASTTPIEPRVLEKMLPYFAEHFGNASSIHSFGQQTKMVLEESRERIAKLLGAQPSEVFFTSGGTESNNFALKGFAMAAVSTGKPSCIVSSRLEHKAVLESLAWIEKFFGIDITYIKHDARGRLDLDDLKNILMMRRAESVLISLMHANNELGNINPIKDIAALAKDYGATLHTDAVQSAGKILLNVRDLNVDMTSMTGHKFHAPKGVGAIYIKQGTAVEPLLHGGSHERNRRAGTENYALALGFAEGLAIAVEEQEKNFLHAQTLRAALLAALEKENVEFSINGDSENSLPHIVNLTFNIRSRRKLAGDVLLLGLDAEGVAASSGSACTSGTEKPSHVLMALGKTEDEARASVRISFSKFNTVEDIEEAATRIGTVLRRLSPQPASTIS